MRINTPQIPDKKQSEVRKTSFTLFDALPQAIAIRAETLDLLYLNRAAEKNSSFLKLLSINEEYMPLQQNIRGKATQLFLQKENKSEHSFKVKYRSECFEIHQVVEELEEGNRVIIESFKDVSEENEKLKQYISSNMQLENLAYSACHDLKEPLRTIGTFTQIIQKKYEHLIDEKSQEYMGFIINGVSRMNHFVDGLFEYATVRESNDNFKTFSLPKLLDFIQMDLRQNIEEKNASISFKNIPPDITANRIKLKQLFQNLITNALKFQQDGIPPRIQVVGSETNTHWHFSFTDNGIGISEKYFDQIFTLFRKLHSKDKYEGSGIGLALCKEIVEQHKGTISVKSEEGQGTTFEFSLLKKLDETNPD